MKAAPPGAGESRTTSLAGSAAITLFGAMSGGALSLLNEALTARFLGVENYGAYSVAVALVKVCEILAVFGAPLTVLRFLPIHVNQSQPRLALGVIAAGALAPLTIGNALACAVFFGSGFLATSVLHQPQTSVWIARLAFAIPLLALTELIGNVARGLGSPLLYVASRNVAPPLVAVLFVSTLLLRDAPGLYVSYGYILAAASGCLFGAVTTFGLIRARLGFPPPTLRLASFYACAAPLAWNAVVTLALLWGDIFVLAMFSDARAVGIYRGCVQINIAFDLVLSAFAAATAPILAVLFAERRNDELRKTLLAATRFAAFLSSPILFVLLFNAVDILRILGPAFEDGAWALSILAVCQFVKATSTAASVALVMSGKQTLEVGNSMIAGGINIALNLLLVPRFGLNGAAAATGASLLLLSALRVAELQWVWRLPVADWAFVRTVLVCGVAVGASWAIAVGLKFGPGGGFVDLAARVALAGVLTCAGLWVFGLSRVERGAMIKFGLARLQPKPQAANCAAET